jgi:hypothetical protein
MAEPPRLGLSVGDDTEEMLQAILAGLSDAELDELKIERTLEKSDGLAGEPVTIGAVITGSAILISAVLRLVERHLETRRQDRALKLVAEGFREDPELGRQLAELAKKHADVAIAQGIAKGAWEA